MGRFYYGDIEGKFWFGVQSSDDISELISYGNPHQSNIWKSCGCNVDEDIPTDKYCMDCYDSKNEHIDIVTEEGDYEDELLYTEDNNISYCLDKDTHYQELLNSMNNLKLSIHKDIIAEFDQIEQNDKILDAFTGVFEKVFSIKNIKYENDREHHKATILIARYTLGFQIEYCLRTTDSCNITCEL
jgi:hypothetical protein